MLPDHKKQFLNSVGFKPDEIAAIEETMTAMASKAASQGIRSKEQTPEQPATEQPKQEPQQQPVDTEAQVTQAQEFIVKALEPILAPLNASIATLQAEIVTLKQQQSQSATLTPAASALAAKSITAVDGAHVISGKGDKGPKENNSDKEAQRENITGIPFLDNLITLNHQRPTAS